MPSGVAAKSYGTVPAERQKEMTGLEFVQGLVDGSLPLNTIAETLGYNITDAAGGCVVIRAEPNETHLNLAGTAHDGFRPRCSIAAWGWRSCRLLKRALARRRSNSRSHSSAESLLKPLTAEGVVLSRGRRVATTEARIKDSKGRLVAHGSTTCLIFER